MCVCFNISTFSLSLITLHWSCHRCRFTYSLFKRCVFIQTRSENETIDQKDNGREQKITAQALHKTHRNVQREENSAREREQERKRKRSVTRYKLCLSISYMFVELLLLLLLLLPLFIDPCLLAAAVAAATAVTATYAHSYNIPYE